jgi:hypothetical protein
VNAIEIANRDQRSAARWLHGAHSADPGRRHATGLTTGRV